MFTVSSVLTYVGCSPLALAADAQRPEVESFVTARGHRAYVFSVQASLRFRVHVTVVFGKLIQLSVKVFDLKNCVARDVDKPLSKLAGLLEFAEVSGKDLLIRAVKAIVILKKPAFHVPSLVAYNDVTDYDIHKVDVFGNMEVYSMPPSTRKIFAYVVYNPVDDQVDMFEYFDYLSANYVEPNMNANYNNVNVLYEDSDVIDGTFKQFMNGNYHNRPVHILKIGDRRVALELKDVVVGDANFSTFFYEACREFEAQVVKRRNAVAQLCGE